MKFNNMSFKGLCIIPIVLVVSACAPSNQESAFSKENMYRNLQKDYEEKYQNMLKMKADSGMICFQMSAAIIGPIEEGNIEDVRKWGRRQIKLDCWNRTYKTTSDLP